MGCGTLLNIGLGLYATIFFVQLQQKSISAAIPAMRGVGALLNFYWSGDRSSIFFPEFYLIWVINKGNKLNKFFMKESGMIINFILFIIFILSCNDIYKAGNSNPELHIQIETNIDQEIAFKYLDSSKTLIKYNLPERLRADLINGDLKYFPFLLSLKPF